MFKITSKILLAIAAGMMLLEAVAPAAAQPWGGPPPPRGWEHRRDHGWNGPPRHRRCWVEQRQVRVWTDHGPRMRFRNVRVCN